MNATTKTNGFPFIKILLYIGTIAALVFFRHHFWQRPGEDNPLVFFLFPVLFLWLPYLLFGILKGFKVEVQKAFFFAAISVFFPAIIFGIIGDFEKEELDANNQETRGVVVKTYMPPKNLSGSDGGRTRGAEPVWTAKVQFHVDGKSYLSNQDDKDTTLQMGDSVTVRYFTKNPFNCEILELKDE